MSNIEDRAEKLSPSSWASKKRKPAEASFVDDLGADSLDTVELVMALEEEFETEILDEEAEKITTVQLVIDYINTNLSERVSAPNIKAALLTQRGSFRLTSSQTHGKMLRLSVSTPNV